jgi:hypothetical protein
MRRVGVFCGASPGRGDQHLALARELGRGLVAHGLGLVYGGARVGLMGALADSCLAAGGTVVGVIPRFMAPHEKAHLGLTELHLVETMHQRKAKMAELSAGFIALPGGLGTLDELFEIATWSYLGLHAKPFCLLDPDGYYRPLLEFLDHSVAHGFVRPEQRATFLHARDVATAVQLSLPPSANHTLSTVP